MRTVHYAKILLKDLCGQIKFGPGAPLFAQKIYINPSKIQKIIQPSIFSRKNSGMVVDGDWDQKVNNLSDHPKYIICHKHFVEGLSWSDAGAYAYLQGLIHKKKVKLTYVLRLMTLLGVTQIWICFMST